MKLWIRSCLAGRLGIYLQLLIPLLLLTALIFGLMATTGCWGCGATSSPKVTKKHSPGATYQSYLNASRNTTNPGGETKRTIGGEVEGYPAPDKITYKYTPPDGASDFKWDPNNPPENPNGPAPYVWRDVPAATEIKFEFTNANLQAGTLSRPCTEVVAADHDDGSKSSVAREFHLGIQPYSLSSVAVQPAVPAQDDELWEAGRYVDIYGITLTTKLCDDWLAVLQSDEAFLAARVPIVSPALPTGSYTIPLAFRGDVAPDLALLEWGEPTPIMTAPVELRPNRFSFANNELPDAPDESYVALGLSPEPLACPTGLNVPADDWGLLGTVFLDLQGQPDNCQGCTLPTYYCYEGQELPAVDPLPQGLGQVLTLARAAGLTAYQGEGITCLGPHYLTLDDGPEWELGGATAGWFPPTVPISFHHYIYNWTGPTLQPITCTVALSSTVGDEWGLYEGDWTGPDQPLVEISQPLRIDDFSRHFWVITDPPEPPKLGAHSLYLNAICEGFADERVAADAIWIGGWIAPPLPATSPVHKVYLPLLMRVYP